MERNQVEDFLNKLQKLDSELTDDSNPDEFSKELNNIIKEISVNLNNDGLDSVKPVLEYINKSGNPDPTFAKEGDSGFDLRVWFTSPEVERILEPGRFTLVPTGLFFAVEKGLEIQVRPRSGLSLKHGLTILNTPGTVDSHYRGEVMIILANLGQEPFVIKNGERIAQGVVSPVYGESKLTMKKVDKLSETNRGAGGFGHTGVK